MRCLLSLCAVALLIALLPGCGGGQSASVKDQSESQTGLPSLAELARETSVVDNDTANGSDYIDAAYQTDSGTAVFLESDSLPAGDLAYAIYSIPERPGETPTMLTVNALYYDEDPTTQHTFEGYWIAYGDFSSGGAGVWRFDGPYMQYQARMEIPATADVINDSGNIFAAVVISDGSRMKLGNVQVGYDLGVDFEEYRLVPPRGLAVGRYPQIAVDGDGNPQVAYVGSTISFGTVPYSLRIAKLVGGEWAPEEVSLPYNVTDTFSFACGSAGRRALLVIDSGDDLHLLWDGGSGTFTDVATLVVSHNDECRPDLAFVNGANVANGELDTVLAVFGDNYVYPNIDMRFFEYDGVNPPATGLIGTERRPGKLYLEVVESQAFLSYPVAPAYPQIDSALLIYSAVADTWLVPAILPNNDIDIDYDYEYYGIASVPDGLGGWFNGYASDADGNIIFSHWDGVAWSTPLVSQVSCALPRPWLDIDTFSDGTVVFPTHYNGFNLAVYEGTVGGPQHFQLHTPDTRNNNAMETSIVVGPDDVAHIACSNLSSGQLDYYAYHQGGTFGEQEVIDQGQDGFGVNFGPCGVVYTDDALHVFSVDASHFRVVHSENRDGIWVREMEAIEPFEGFSYFMMKAGYLETTGQLWVAYIDIMDFGVYVCYTDPPNGDDWTWHRYKVCDVFDQPAVGIEDDETNLACTFMDISPFTGGVTSFGISPLGQTPVFETITNEYHLCDFPQILSYNKLDQTWNLLTTDDEMNRTYLWHRPSPGLWEGPHIIAALPEEDDTALAAGITYHEATGLARVLVYEMVDATGVFDLSVYGQQSLGNWNFGSPITFLTGDVATTYFAAIGVVPDNDGNPFVAVVSRPVANPTLDVDFYRYDGLGNWAIEQTWNSALEDTPMETIMFYPLVMRSNGDYAFAATEMSFGAPAFGRIWAYYPW